jgi:UDP-glucose 4-epimerase
MEWLQTNKRTEVFNLGTGKGNSVREVVNLCKEITGIDFKVAEIARRPGDAVAIWADSTKAQQLLGWQTEYSLEDMIRTAWNWHTSHPNGYK